MAKGMFVSQWWKTSSVSVRRPAISGASLIPASKHCTTWFLSPIGDKFRQVSLDMVAPLRVGIAGLGTVGAEVVRLIDQQKRVLSARCGRGVRVVAVSARSKAKKRSV